MVRGELSDAELDEQLRGLWRMRADRYSELRAQGATVDLPKVEMSHIGG
jgi:cyclic pyranopterin phosphate synthase